MVTFRKEDCLLILRSGRDLEEKAKKEKRRVKN
jgi:hypothetical protein